MKLPIQIMLKKVLRCAGVPLMVTLASAASWPRDPQPLIPVPGVPLYGFEQDVPIEFHPDADSHLTLNHRYYRKGGDTSLRWDWERRGSTITIACPAAFPGEDALARPHIGTGVPRLVCERIPVFSAWIYGESAQEGMLEFQIRGGEDVLGQFLVSLNFTGWKELRIPYRTGLPRQADTLCIIAPATARTGTLYFDLLSPWRDLLTWREYPPGSTLWPTPSSPDNPATYSRTPQATSRRSP